MTHIIKNNTLEVAVDLPLENYRGSRFDWSGKISVIKFLAIPFTTVEDPSSKDIDFLEKLMKLKTGQASSRVSMYTLVLGGRSFPSRSVTWLLELLLLL